MQDDSSLRRSEQQKAKPSRELPSSTLWLRDEAESTGAQGLSDAESSEKGAILPSALEDVPSADAHPSLLEEADAKERHARDAQQPAVPSVHEKSEELPDIFQSANERVGDGVDTEDKRDTAVASAASIAREESGFQAWPSTASEVASNGRDSLSVVLGLAALSGLLFGAWNYSVLERTRAQLSFVTAEKAAVDRSLADAQGRLAAAEKAVADVKSALATPVGAAGNKVTSPKP